MVDARGGAIGIFDSGVGGLTVVREIWAQLPNESTVYLGDTARIPYGTRSPSTVIRYASACAKVLLDRSVKLMIVACNTASACALEPLREQVDIPVLGVVEPGAREAAGQTRNGRVGVIGTVGTIRSGEYERAILAADPSIEVFEKACPLFVPLAEEGWTRGAVPRAIADEYLSELRRSGIDTLVLGCTHYPLLRDAIAETIGGDITLVDSAAAHIDVVLPGYTHLQQAQPVLFGHYALALFWMLAALGEEVDGDQEASHTFLASDSPRSFSEVGHAFLAQPVDNVEWVDF